MTMRKDKPPKKTREPEDFPGPTVKDLPEGSFVRPLTPIERRTTRTRRYYEANRPKLLAQAKINRTRNPVTKEYMAAYRAAHREQLRTISQKSYARHKAETAAKVRARYQSDPEARERKKAQQRKHYQENLEECREKNRLKNQKSRAKKKLEHQLCTS